MQVNISVQNDQYIINLLDYLNICFKQIYSFASGQTKHLLLKALTDLMGGYLHVYVIPIVKVSFYSGSVNFENCHKIFKLHNKFKEFLHTEGEGWSLPLQMSNFNFTLAYPFDAMPSSEACNGLITYSKSKNFNENILFAS